MGQTFISQTCTHHIRCNSEVIEVINLDDPDASPTYEALPNLAKKATGAKPMQTASVPPSASGTPLAGVLGPLAATAIMFDDAPCPPLDPFAKYWVSLHGVEAGVFNSKLVNDLYNSISE